MDDQDRPIRPKSPYGVRTEHKDPNFQILWSILWISELSGDFVSSLDELTRFCRIFFFYFYGQHTPQNSNPTSCVNKIRDMAIISLSSLHFKALVLFILIAPSLQFSSTTRTGFDSVFQKISYKLRMAESGVGGESSGSGSNTAFKPSIVLTAAGSDLAITAAEAEAMKHGWEVTICVCDAGGVPIQVKRNSFPASYDIAVGKAKTAAQFGKETGVLEKAVNVAQGTSRTSLLSSPFILMRGGVPFIIDGVICGAIGVSGVQAAQDEQVAKAGVAALADLV